MSQTSFFCSELSLRASENSFGTASVGGAWLLLEYPYPWGPKALPDSSLSPEIKSFLNRALASIPRSRLLLIKRGRGCEGGIKFFVVRCREREPFVVKFELRQYDDLAQIDIPSVAAGRKLAGGRISEQPLFLICTHGKRDKCCAIFGRPLYKSLRQIEGENVWQSSHVGGDRFAGNLVCFPHGLFYAHATEESGRRIARAYRERRLVLDEFRGRACYAYHVQAAEFFVRSEATIEGVEGLRLLEARQLDEKYWMVRFGSAVGPVIHEAKVVCRDSEFTNYVTCQSTSRRRVPQFRLEEYRQLEERSLALS